MNSFNFPPTPEPHESFGRWFNEFLNSYLCFGDAFRDAHPTGFFSFFNEDSRQGFRLDVLSTGVNTGRINHSELGEFTITDFYITNQLSDGEAVFVYITGERFNVTSKIEQEVLGVVVANGDVNDLCWELSKFELTGDGWVKVGEEITGHEQSYSEFIDPEIIKPSESALEEMRLHAKFYSKKYSDELKTAYSNIKENNSSIELQNDSDFIGMYWKRGEPVEETEK
ncbi:hypothetical protein INR79_07890 [Vibrio sp. SCSIO 43132]|uniref:hypothetical protein n=1 Tax=Vibrio sp. SCSIO 43132 TaxID=2779363 RepID=UPI001CAA3672|nr:hypothetical protein [Vibrio sp. SCSIO 43132]UAB71803.1 hypothetical protein INR79_07890 [Vibrio sp. SCSIO 43132]